MAISVEGLPRTTVINIGQHILIEGEDEDNPFVAKVVKLFGESCGVDPQDSDIVLKDSPLIAFPPLAVFQRAARRRRRWFSGLFACRKCR